MGLRNIVCKILFNLDLQYCSMCSYSMLHTVWSQYILITGQYTSIGQMPFNYHIIPDTGAGRVGKARSDLINQMHRLWAFQQWLWIENRTIIEDSEGEGGNLDNFYQFGPSSNHRRCPQLRWCSYQIFIKTSKIADYIPANSSLEYTPQALFSRSHFAFHELANLCQEANNGKFIILTFQISAMNFLFILFLMVGIPIPQLHWLIGIVSLIWTAIVILSKMLFQLKTIKSGYWYTNCSDVSVIVSVSHCISVSHLFN